MKQRETHTPIITLRLAVFLILLLGMFGTGAELILLSHIEDQRQWIPVVLISLGLLTSGWHWARRSAPSIRVLQVILCGFAGMYFHYQGSAEFNWNRIHRCAAGVCSAKQFAARRRHCWRPAL